MYHSIPRHDIAYHNTRTPCHNRSNILVSIYCIPLLRSQSYIYAAHYGRIASVRKYELYNLFTYIDEYGITTTCA